jgi:hypothetical protein
MSSDEYDSKDGLIDNKDKQSNKHSSNAPWKLPERDKLFQ